VVVGSVTVLALFGLGHHGQIDRPLRQPIPFCGSTEPRHAPFPPKSMTGVRHRAAAAALGRAVRAIPTSKALLREDRR
jgi:hypothetical protein